MRVPFYQDYLNQVADFSALKPFEKYENLVCISDGLSPEWVINAYQNGVFPWHEDEDGDIYWFASNPRAILLPENLKISHSLAKRLKNKNKPYLVVVNRDFRSVIESCAQVPRMGQNGTWISPNFQQTYLKLHEMGYAHSFECYMPDFNHNLNNNLKLVGGLYGIQIGRVFYGESMFARETDASKIAFVWAMRFLQESGIELIDCQQDTEHLASLGSKTIDLKDFIQKIKILNQEKLLRPIPNNHIIFDNHFNHLG